MMFLCGVGRDVMDILEKSCESENESGNENGTSDVSIKKSQMSPVDEIRLKVLEALFDPNGLKPNIDYISKKTGLTRRTIYQSLEFLREKKVILDYHPVLDVSKLGYSLISLGLLELDMTNAEAFEEFRKKILSDPNIIMASGLMGLDSYNFIVKGIYRSVDEHNCCIRDKYSAKFPGFSVLMKKRRVLYFPLGGSNMYKVVSPGHQAVKMLAKK